MWFKFVFPLFFVFAATAVEDCRMTDRQNSLIPAFQIPKHESIPMPRPAPGEPVIVKASADILTASIDEKEQEFEAIFFFRYEWNDPRLAYESKDNEEFRLITNLESIWTPDLFFVKNLRNQTNKDEVRTIKLYPNGRVLSAEKKIVKTSCRVNLGMYPFDTQVCKLKIESFGYTTNDIIVQWNTSMDNPPVTEHLLSHERVISVQAKEAITIFRNVKYSSARMVFHLSRTPTAIICRVIVPIFVIGLCSWTSFLLSWSENAVRISLCISPIVTYILQINFCLAFFSSPIYLTSLDVWAATSLVAMLISSVECICVACRKETEDDCAERGPRKRKIKSRIALALFVTLLDVLSIVCVFLSRLL